ncbi:hypothetical protein PG913_08505 [Tenacibaculum pacificus]|uniref:hypothetical protein n=1 Tax=Tenacibaculum pacificus TaxID=3018314 RepID=UPI0022F3A0F3|nr:hypothetical protein [Tenacibaculum pacificus]WBX72941.1 hypothetical protein PG913_08505 [Tenacibaculum pacificus]
MTEEIIKLSNSDIWSSAKLEWNFEYAYYSEELQRCLCGHYPIKNVCVIKNSDNKNETEVGNCCVNKFLGIEDGNKIFTSIKKLKIDKSKSMSPEVLEYLRKKNVLTEFDYKFYSDTIRKRKLSDKQLAIRERINQKLIDFTSYESNSNFTRINLVLKWAEDKSWFDKTFVNSLKSSCEKKGKLTEKQTLALESIIKKLKIE